MMRNNNNYKESKFKKNTKFNKHNNNYEPKVGVEAESMTVSQQEKERDVKRNNDQQIITTSRYAKDNEPLVITIDKYDGKVRYANAYALIGKPYNKTMDINYTGEPNIVGNRLISLEHENDPRIKKYIDYMFMPLDVNYNYLDGSNIDSAIFVRADEVMKQALSKTLAETYREFDFFRFKVNNKICKEWGTIFDEKTREFKVNNGKPSSYVLSEEELVKVKKEANEAYDKQFSDKNLYILHHYQTIAQNIAHTIRLRNDLMSYFNVLSDIEFKDNLISLQKVMNIMKKKLVVSRFTSFSMRLTSYYFDKDWYNQNAEPFRKVSRSRNEHLSPMKQILVRDKIDPITVSFEKNILYKDGTTDLTKAVLNDRLHVPHDIVPLIQNILGDLTYKFIDEEINGKKITNCYLIDDMDAEFKAIQALLTPFSLLFIARNDISENSYINLLMNLMDDISGKLLIYERSLKQSVDTVLYVAGKIGLNYWSQNNMIEVQNNPEQVMFDTNYKIIDDVYRLVFNSSIEMEQNSVTKRWRFYSLLDFKRGINTFDKMSGGCVLSYAFRNIINENGQPLNENGQTGYLIPRLFRNKGNFNSNRVTAKVMNREGMVFDLTRYKKPVTSKTEALGRLTLTDANDSIPRAIIYSFPTLGVVIDKASTLKDKKNEDVPYHLFFLEREFGCGLILNTYKYKGDEEAVTETEGKGVFINNDKIMFLDLEINDITIEVDNYIRSYCPFRISLHHQGRDLGFKG